MAIPETFYIALCGTILLLGIVYWFWTQVQYLQRKVNLLDNVVYEIKSLVSNLPGPSAVETQSGAEHRDRDNTTNKEEPYANSIQETYAPPPESVAGDLEAERRASEEEFESFSGSTNVKPFKDEPEIKQQAPDDLQPGGLAVPAENVKKLVVENDNSIESPLSSMSLKELRRMAESQGVPGFNELKKKDLIRALRDKVSGIINNDSESRIMSFDEIDAPTLE